MDSRIPRMDVGDVMDVPVRYGLQNYVNGKTCEMIAMSVQFDWEKREWKYELKTTGRSEFLTMIVFDSYFDGYETNKGAKEVLDSSY